MFKFNPFKRKKDINEQEVDIVGEDIRRKGGSLVMSEEAIDWEQTSQPTVYRDLEEDAPIRYREPRTSEELNDIDIEVGGQEAESRKDILDNVGQHNLDGYGKQVTDQLMDIHSEIDVDTIEKIEQIMESTQGSDNFMYDFISEVEKQGIKLMYLVALDFLTEEDLAEYHRMKQENAMDTQQAVTSYEDEIRQQYEQRLEQERKDVEEEMVQDYVQRTGGVQEQVLLDEDTEDSEVGRGLVQPMPEPPVTLGRYERIRRQQEQAEQQPQVEPPTTEPISTDVDADFEAIYGQQKKETDWLAVEIDLTETEDFEPSEYLELQEVSEAERVNLTVGEWIEFTEDVTAEIPEEVVIEPITQEEEQEQFEKEKIESERRAYIATLKMYEAPAGADTEDDFEPLSDEDVEAIYQQGTQMSEEEIEREKQLLVQQLTENMKGQDETGKKAETVEEGGLGDLLAGLKKIKNPEDTQPKPSIDINEPPRIPIDLQEIINLREEDTLLIEEQELEREVDWADVTELYGEEKAIPQDIYSQKTQEEIERIRAELDQTRAELYQEQQEQEKEETVEEKEETVVKQGDDNTYLEEYIPDKVERKVVTELEEYIPTKPTTKVVTDLEEYKYPTEAEKRLREQATRPKAEDVTDNLIEVDKPKADKPTEKPKPPYMPKLKSDYVAGNIDKVQEKERPTVQDVETLLEETVREVKRERNEDLTPKTLYFVYDGELPKKMGKYKFVMVRSLAELIMYETNSENLLVITNKIPSNLLKDLGKWLQGAKQGIIKKRVVTLRNYAISDSLIQSEIDLTEKSIDNYYIQHPKNQFDEEKIRSQRASILDYIDKGDI